MRAYREIFEYNRQWAAECLGSDADFFSKLAKGQHPGYLYIGCSDSRVPAELLTGARAGDFFVHRNVGNVVDPSDPNAMSVIFYAVSHLEVQHIVVCGHYLCGGVKASMAESANGPLDPWLDHIRIVADEHKDELDGIEDEDKRYQRLVELNVLAQCRTLAHLPVVKGSHQHKETPHIHGWVFDIQSGELKDLDFTL